MPITRSSDPFNGARGHDYIRLRGLSPKISLGRKSESECQCAPCIHARLLPAILRICGQRAPATLPDLPQPLWNDVNNELAHELLDQVGA